MTNFNIKQYITENKLLQEIKVNKPITIDFKSNLELKSYLEQNVNEYEKLMKEIYYNLGYSDETFNVTYLVNNGKPQIETRKEIEKTFGANQWNSSYNKQNPELITQDSNFNDMNLSIEPLQIDYIKDSKQIKLGPNTIYYAWDE
jgi:hypothetical protein